MTERALNLDEFLVTIRPELERQIDEAIMAEPDLEARLVLMLHREQLVRELVYRTKVANLEYRLAEAQERLRPRLVE